MSKKTKRLYVIRILNALFILTVVGLGLSLIWTGDDQNRFFQGKAIGGAIGIIAVFAFVFFVAATIAHKEANDPKKTFSIFKDAILALLSPEPTWKSSKKSNRRK